MNGQYGVVNRTDTNTVMRTITDTHLGEMITRQGFTASGGITFPRDISGFFLAASGNVSHFAMNFWFKDYAVPQNEASYRIPVFGTKGLAEGITRRTNYVHWAIADENDIRNTDYFKRVFGTRFVTPSESVFLSETEIRNLIEQEAADVSCNISEQDIPLVIRVTEKIWEAQEKSLETRFVIEMNNAQNRSLNLIREILLLLPHSIRLQMGFETNVAKEDLDVIQAHGLPIYLLTSETGTMERSGRYRFPIVFFDADHPEQYDYDEHRLSLLTNISKTLSKTSMICFDYAEKRVSRETETYGRRGISSFRLYEKITEAFLSPDLYWWEKKDLGNLQDIRNAFLDQSELMSIPELKSEALKTFCTRFLENSELIEHMVRLSCSEIDEEQRALLNFFNREIQLEPFSSVIEKVTKEQKEVSNQALAEALDKQKEELNANAEKEVRELRSIHEQAISKKDEEISKKDKEIDNIRQVSKQAQKQISVEAEKSKRLLEEKEKQEEYITKLEKNTKKQQEKINSSEKKITDLEKLLELARGQDINDLYRKTEDLESRLDKEKKSNRENEKYAEKMRKSASISKVLAIVLTVLVAATGVGTGLIYSGRTSILKELEAANREKDSLTAEKNDLQEQITQLSSEKEDLVQERDELKKLIPEFSGSLLLPGGILGSAGTNELDSTSNNSGVLDQSEEQSATEIEDQPEGQSSIEMQDQLEAVDDQQGAKLVIGEENEIPQIDYQDTVIPVI